jgi:hypothetical protein
MPTTEARSQRLDFLETFVLPISYESRGEYMAGLRFIKVGPSGGTGGTPFSALGEAFLPSDNPHRISRINIWSGIYIDAIQLEFTGLSGATALTPIYGDNSTASMTPFKLEPAEFILEVIGTYGDYVDSITIKTNLRKLPTLGGKGPRKYEYWNENKEKPIHIQGIWGSSGRYLDAIGFFIADD